MVTFTTIEKPQPKVDGRGSWLKSLTVEQKAAHYAKMAAARKAAHAARLSDPDYRATAKLPVPSGQPQAGELVHVRWSGETDRMCERWAFALVREVADGAALLSVSCSAGCTKGCTSKCNTVQGLASGTVLRPMLMDMSRVQDRANIKWYTVNPTIL